MPAIRELDRQMDMLEEHFGMTHGYLNYQGILNIAFKLRGNDLFLDMVDDPGFVHRLFAHVAETIAQTTLHVQARQRRSGFAVNLLSMSNCVMNMISPGLYERFVLPLDEVLSRKFELFGVHTCNWSIDPYLESLRKIVNMGYLDMGIDSDMGRAREMFPEARRAVLYSPVALTKKDVAAIRRDIGRIHRELAPCDIVMADITADTPDERVHAFLSLVAEACSGPGCE